MRTLHADLTTAQTAASATPYLTITFTKGKGGATTYTYTTADSPNKIKALRHVEEPYNDYAILVLDNYDGALPDLFGYYCTIGYGYNTASGNRSSNTAPLWVKKQFHTSKPGEVDRILYLEGSWNLLREMKDIGSLLGAIQPPYYEVDYTGASYTIYDIINQVLIAAGYGLYALGGEDDSIVDTLQPDFVVNSVPFEDAATVIYRLLNMTKVFCRAETEATSAVISANTISTTTDVASLIGINNRKTFWAASRYWAFYTDGTNLSYKSSTDGSSWSSETDLAAAVTNEYALTYDARTGKVAYVRAPSGDSKVYWRQGSPQPDGTITWDAVEQTVRTGVDQPVRPNCCFDSNGIAWVTWGEDADPWVSKNANTDGTWSDATNFPHELSTDNRVTTTPVPLLDGKVYVAGVASTGDPNSFYGWLWNTTWGSEEAIDDAGDPPNSSAWSVVAIGDVVHFIYKDVNPATDEVVHCERSTAGTWTQATVFVEAAGHATLYPQATDVSGMLYMFYVDSTTKKVYYRRYDGAWDASSTEIFTATGGMDGKMCSPYQAFDGRIFLIWMANGSSPYDIIAGIYIVNTSSFRIKYPSGYSSYDYTYTSDQTNGDHQFREFEWRDQIIIPTHVYVLANQAADGNWDSVIVGKHETAISNNNQYPKIVEYYVASTLTNQTDADNRAAAIAVRRQMESELGRIVVPHNCGQELYDWVKIRDKRPTGSYVDYPPTRWGNEAIVGSLIHVFDPARGVYDLEITINGIESSAPVDATIPTFSRMLEDIGDVQVDVEGMKDVIKAFSPPEDLVKNLEEFAQGMDELRFRVETGQITEERRFVTYRDWVKRFGYPDPHLVHVSAEELRKTTKKYYDWLWGL